MQILSIVSLVLVCFLAGCGKSEQATSEATATIDYTRAQLDSIGRAYVPEIGTYGGTVNLALEADPDGFCPMLVNSGYSQTILGFIYEGLVSVDPVTLEHTPHIASSWSVSEDGLEWIFKLRRDVFFSDSVQLTAEDVLFSFNDIVYNEKLNSPLNHNFRVDGEKIDISAPDSFTVVFKLPKPFAPFLTIVGISILPKHLYAEAAADGTLESFLASGTDPQNVIGTGPFKLSKVELGQQVVLERNPYYWKTDREGNRLPYLDAVRFLIVKEPNMLMMKFRKGEIDEYMVSGQYYPLLKPHEKTGNYRLYRVGPRWYDRFFAFNQNNQINEETNEPFLDEKKQYWFRNKLFRQACAYAINYDEITNIIFNGLAYPPAGIWGEHKGVFHNPDARLYNYDPKRADSLLNALSFIDRDGDGIREDDRGNPIEFTITTSAGSEIISNMYGIIRKDLENLGFKVHMNYIEFNTMIARTMNTYDWDVCGYALGGVRDPHFAKSSVVPTSFRYLTNPQRKDSAGLPIAKYDRPEEARISEIFDSAVQIMDEEERAKLYGEWQAIVQEESNIIYLPISEVILGIQNKFGNIQLCANLSLTESLLHNIEEIFILPSTENQ